jgi:3-isopropylmalate/(R)-2-methylmalate dehydratase small subunit
VTFPEQPAARGFRQLDARTIVLPLADIDTDQIIPARFLTTTSREGMGRYLFYDWRYRDDGTLNDDFVLNAPDCEDCRVLVAGDNFGCGSSREHAAWALLDYGFRAVVSTRMADIFRSNALKNGLLPIEVDESAHRWMLDNPGATLHIDVVSSALTLPTGRSVQFLIDGFARHCLVEGIDPLGFLQQHLPAIASFEQGRSWKP